jgi:hypothetical protein
VVGVEANEADEPVREPIDGSGEVVDRLRVAAGVVDVGHAHGPVDPGVVEQRDQLLRWVDPAVQLRFVDVGVEVDDHVAASLATPAKRRAIPA